MKKTLVFIINPIAGKGSGKKIMELIVSRYSRTREFMIQTHLTQYPKHATVLAHEALFYRPDVIVAVGGDGTIHEIASVLIGTKVPLGIIPVGSGNGLARHLQIPSDFHKAMKTIELFNPEKIDAGKINDNYFFCTAGVGFDAHVGALFANKAQRGFRSYIKIVLQEVFSYKPKKYKLNIDGLKVKERAVTVTFANAAQYGNNAFIAPLASTHDGLLDVSILKPFPMLKAAGISYRLFNKSFHLSKYVKTYKGNKISLKRKKPGEVHMDGEPIMMGKKLIIMVIPRKLYVICGSMPQS